MTTEGRGPGARRLDDPLLRLDGVTAGYGATTVLEEVSVDVGDGALVGIVGRNGVGTGSFTHSALPTVHSCVVSVGRRTL